MLPQGKNKVPGCIKQGGGPDSAHGLVFATCALGAQDNAGVTLPETFSCQLCSAPWALYYFPVLWPHPHVSPFLKHQVPYVTKTPC